MLKKLIVTTGLLLGSNIAMAENNNFYSKVENYLVDEWNKSDTQDLYVPLHTWHNRKFYSSESINKYNENPYGMGLGVSYRDDNSNWHGYYAMMFLDSHSKVEPIAGYAYVKNLVGSKNGLNAGLGYTAFITARDDYSYIPIPGLLPIASIGYKKFTINATYVPGGTGNGNVAFVWSQYNF